MRGPKKNRKVGNNHGRKQKSSKVKAASSSTSSKFKDKQKLSNAKDTSSDVKQKKKEPLILLASLWRQELAILAIIIEGDIIATILGANPWPTTSPLVVFMLQYPIISLVIGGALIVLSLASLLPLIQKRRGYPDKLMSVSRRFFTSITPVGGYTLFVALVLLILIRPPWCSDAICPAPIYIPITSPNGVHDANLDLSFLLFQSMSYEVPGDPAHQSYNALPQKIGAVRVDEQKTSPYRVVLKVHDLQQGHYNMFIEQVALSVEQVPPMPNPLHVWIKGASLDYRTNLYEVSYNGQEAGSVLFGTYLPLTHTHMQLAPGETDDIEIQLTSLVLADIKYRVLVTYRVGNEAISHTLILPNVYEVIFSNMSNWDVCQIRVEHVLSCDTN